jgi:predicted ATP-dependent serine protease
MKTLTECKTCGARIAKSASKCPQCGASKSTLARAVAIAVGGLVLAVLFYAMWIKPTLEKMQDMDAIERQIRSGR